MIAPIKLRLPAALGGAEIVGEIELPDNWQVTPGPTADLDDDGLCSRWGTSKRSLKRLRDRKLIAYYEVLPKHYRYKTRDVEAFERARGTQARRPAASVRP